MDLTSSAFEHNGAIPAKYTCDGDDVSPPLSWAAVPQETESLALICDDPDAPAGTWSHWVLYNISPDRDGLEENVPTDERLSQIGMQGRNDFGNSGYGGPCPPRDSSHHYYFRLYALDTTLEAMEGATRKQVLNRIQDHILAQTELIGLYART